MRAWRIAKRQYALDRQGTGAQITGGRWNSPGIAVVYAGLTAEIAAMEKLVHTSDILPSDLVLVSIELPDDEALYQRIQLADMPEGWDAMPSSASAVAVGGAFVTDGRRLGLIIPSAVVPEALNIVLNPNHSAFSHVTFTIERPFTFDHRLRPGN